MVEVMCAILILGIALVGLAQGRSIGLLAGGDRRGADCLGVIPSEHTKRSLRNCSGIHGRLS